MAGRILANASGVLAAAGSMGLSVIFVYFNPYSNVQADASIMVYILLLVVCPALLALIALFMQKRSFMFISFFWSLPACLYLGLAKIFSWWNFFCIALLLYVISASLLKSSTSGSNEERAAG